MDFLPGQPCGIFKGLLNLLPLQIRVPVISPDIRFIPVTSFFDGPDPFFYAFLNPFNVIKNLFNRTCVFLIFQR
jgi:hypothetical protein